MFLKKNKNKTAEQTPVEWLVGYLKKFNCIQDTLSTRKAIEKALKMERNKFCLHDVISSVCDCITSVNSEIEIKQNKCSYCHKMLKQTDL